MDLKLFWQGTGEIKHSNTKSLINNRGAKKVKRTASSTIATYYIYVHRSKEVWNNKMEWSTYIYHRRRLGERASPYQTGDRSSPSTPKASRRLIPTTRTNHLRGSSPLSSQSTIRLSPPRARPWQQMPSDLRSKNPSPARCVFLCELKNLRDKNSGKPHRYSGSPLLPFSTGTRFARCDLHRSNMDLIWIVGRSGADLERQI